jgi:hypothetical protein
MDKGVNFMSNHEQDIFTLREAVSVKTKEIAELQRMRNTGKISAEVAEKGIRNRELVRRAIQRILNIHENTERENAGFVTEYPGAPVC